MKEFALPHCLAGLAGSVWAHSRFMHMTGPTHIDIEDVETTSTSWPGGLPDDMNSATTGLLTLEGQSLPPGSSSGTHRPLIIPEVRRPSLRAGSGSTSLAAPHAAGTDHRLARRPSFVEGGSREHSLDAEFPALGNMEGRHAAQTFRWQQQHFGERSNSRRRS